MKPFDLEAAKRGEPVVTRDGRNVTKFCYFDDKELNTQYPIYVSLSANKYNEADILSATVEGKNFHASSKEYPTDLFMAPKKAKKWQVIYTFNEKNVAQNAFDNYNPYQNNKVLKEIEVEE